ncbi:MAG TPA: TolC family protein [Candidatus Acidoferrales bacterium]|nr:TolC family protein [Candidatus Acidoferrales bacterium]
MKLIKLAVTAGAVCAANAWAGGTNSLPTLTLTNAQALALRQHPQIASADYLVLAAQEVVKETRAGLFPLLNLYGDAVAANDDNTRILAGGLNNPTIYDRAAGGLQLNQLITDFGRTANLTASSQLQAEAQNQNLEQTREQVLLQVDTGYYGALGAQALLNVARQTLQTRQMVLDQITALATNLLRSQLDVSFAQVQVQQARLLVESAQNNDDAAMARLSTALGYREFHAFQLVDQSAPTNGATYGPTNLIADLVQTALAQRPELLQLRNQQDAALRFAKAQRDARFPLLEAVGVGGGSPDHNSHLPDDYAAGGVQLSVPLFAGGLYAARQHEAELRAESDAELLRALEDEVIRDVRIAWLNVNTAVEQLQTSEELVRNSQEAFTLSEARYKNGLSSIVELSEAQLNLTEAQISEVNAQYGVLIQQANLTYQIGALR